MAAQTGGQVMTLANSIIGVGILAMPFCFQKCGILLAILLILISNFLTRITCHYVVKSAILTRRRNYEFLGFHAFGFSGKLLVELCIIGYLMGTCIAYFVVVGDLGPQMVSKLFNLNNSDALRTWIMVIVTLICVIPLGLLKNVDSLSAVCTASIGFYCCLVVKVISESKSHIMDEDLFEKIYWWRPSGVLQCLPIFSMALSCQMQIFEVYETMTSPSLEKMNGIVKSATNICTCVYILVGSFGYIAYHEQAFSGNILLNFSSSLTSDIIVTGFVISIAFSFPLVIFPCRASLYSLLYRRNHSEAANYIPEPRFRWITIVIALFTMIMGLLIPSIELVIGLLGSTIGVAICIMFPSSCFIKISKKESNEKILAQLVLIFGFTLMILGTYANLNAIDEKKSGAHLEEPYNILFTIPPPLGFEHHDNPFGDKNVPNLPEHMQEIHLDHFQENDLKVLDQENNVIIAQPTEKQLEILPPIEEEIVNKFPHEDSNDKIDVVDPIEQVAVAAAVEELKNVIEEKKEEIDVNAINKEDHEIAIENKEQVVEEIKKLEETKKQLQEEVAEIKKELEEQSLNNQNLIEEKLEAISRKVDDIEAKNKLKENEVGVKTDSVVELVNGGGHRSPIVDVKSIDLDDAKPIEHNEKPINQDIPDSYKIGESILKNKSSHLLPPIPIILANFSNSLKPDSNQPNNNENNKQFKTSIKSNISINKIVPEVKQQQSAEKVIVHKDDNELIDSIRRDLLEVNNKKSLDDITEIVDVHHLRDKRQVGGNSNNNENCDINKNQDTKVLNSLLESASNNFVSDLKVNLNVVGRNLMSVSDENDTSINDENHANN